MIKKCARTKLYIRVAGGAGGGAGFARAVGGAGRGAVGWGRRVGQSRGCGAIYVQLAFRRRNQLRHTTQASNARCRLTPSAYGTAAG